MAFRKTFRRSPTRKFRAKSAFSRVAGAVARKAPKRYNWVSSVDHTCDVANLPPRICQEDPETETFLPHDVDCVTGVIAGAAASAVRVVIVPPATPANTGTDQGAYLTDDITIRRIVGHIRMMPYWSLTADAVAIVNTFPLYQRQGIINQFLVGRRYLLRAGIKKDDLMYDALVDNFVWPDRNPWPTENFVDGRFSRTWEREKLPGYGGSTASLNTPSDFQLGCCPIVTGSGGGGGQLINTLTSGSGNINTDIDDIVISTTCQPCYTEAPEPTSISQAQSLVTNAVEHAVTLNISSRQPYRLRENQGLAVHLNYGTFSSQNVANCVPGMNDYLAVGWIARMHIKVLIET